MSLGSDPKEKSRSGIFHLDENTPVSVKLGLLTTLVFVMTGAAFWVGSWWEGQARDAVALKSSLLDMETRLTEKLNVVSANVQAINDELRSDRDRVRSVETTLTAIQGDLWGRRQMSTWSWHLAAWARDMGLRVPDPDAMFRGHGAVPIGVTPPGYGAPPATNRHEWLGPDNMGGASLE